jgi:serine phosphatase RsbU (regulator of sigma subunit)
LGVTEPLRLQGPQGPVLGIFERAAYQNSHCEASENDLIVLFTDGLFEVEVAEDEYYGAERLLAAVGKRMQLPAAQLFGEVVAEIQRCCVSGRFTDDMCLLGVELRRTGLADSSRKVA